MDELLWFMLGKSSGGGTPSEKGSGTIPFSNIFECIESKFGGNE